jgi:hypothetical protein
VLRVAIMSDNLEPFLTALGWVVGYTADGDDLEAVSNGLRDTDAEEGRWYAYEFHGRHRADFSLAFDEAGSGVVLFQIELPDELAPQVRLFADFCWQFHWHTPGHPKPW